MISLRFSFSAQFAFYLSCCSSLLPTSLIPPRCLSDSPVPPRYFSFPLFQFFLSFSSFSLLLSLLPISYASRHRPPQNSLLLPFLLFIQITPHYSQFLLFLLNSPNYSSLLLFPRITYQFSYSVIPNSHGTGMMSHKFCPTITCLRVCLGAVSVFGRAKLQRARR